jgi:hypothetical protein
MSNRRVIFALMSVLALTLPVAASAQTARVEGMTLQGDYIKDYTGIYTYPSQVPNVGNLVYGELGNLFSPPATFDRSVGAVIGNLWDGRLGTWAIHLREETPQLGQGDAFSQPAPGDLGFDPNVNTNESFDLMWGRKFGTTSFGVRVNRSFAEFESDIGGVITELEFDPALAGLDGTPNTARNIFGLGVGVGFEINPTTMAEVALNWQNRTFVNNDPTVPVDGEEDNATAYQLAARAMWQWQPNVMLVPVFKWYSYDLSTTDNLTATSADNTLSGWQIGAAGNWTVGANDLFVLGLTFAQNRVEQEAGIFASTLPGVAEEITEALTPQLFAALETHVNTWLTLRFGASKGAWHKIEEEDETTGDNVEISDSPFDMALGAGVKIGTLQLDAIVNDLWPHVGPYLFGGTSAGPMFPKVTATYAF